MNKCWPSIGPLDNIPEERAAWCEWREGGAGGEGNQQMSMCEPRASEAAKGPIWEQFAGLGGPLLVSAVLVLHPSPALDDAEHPHVDRRRRRPHSFGRLILTLCRRRARRQQRRCDALSDFGPVPCLCVPLHFMLLVTCFNFHSFVSVLNLVVPFGVIG